MTLPTSVGSLVERVKRDALLGTSGPIYTLAAAYTADGTSMTLAQSPSAISVFSVLSIDESLYLVTSVDEVGSILMVIPDYQGSTSANHAIGDIVEVDARFPTAALINWAQLEILSWGSKLWRVRTTEVVLDTNQVTYNLPLQDASDDVLFLLDARREPQEGTFTDRWPHVPTRLLRAQHPTDFPSTFAIQLTEHPWAASRLRVTYASSFKLSAFTSATDLLTDVGLRSSHLDLLEHGVRWRALVSPISSRTDWRAAGLVRDGQEVNVLDVIRAADMSKSLRDEALAREANELRREFPFKDSS